MREGLIILINSFNAASHVYFEHFHKNGFFLCFFALTSPFLSTFLFFLRLCIFTFLSATLFGDCWRFLCFGRRFQILSFRLHFLRSFRLFPDMDFKIKLFTIDDKRVKLTIWDTGFLTKTRIIGDDVERYDVLKEKKSQKVKLMMILKPSSVNKTSELCYDLSSIGKKVWVIR